MNPLADVRAKLEATTPPPPPPEMRGQLELGYDIGAVAGVAGDEVVVRAGIDEREGSPVCLVTVWDADTETVATVGLGAKGVAGLVALLTAFGVEL